MKTRVICKGVVLLFIFGWNQLAVGQSPDSLTTFTEQQIVLNAYVENSKVPSNRPVVLQIELSWPGKLSRYQIEPVSQPILTNLLLEGSGSENRLLTDDQGNLQAIKAITYRLRPLEMGMAYIDGVIIKYQDRETGETENLSSQRIMVEIIEPLPEENPGRLKATVYVLLLLLFFFIIGYFLIQYFRKKRQAKQDDSPAVSLGESYLNRLTQEVDPRGRIWMK